MQKTDLIIHQAFKGFAPRDWKLSKSINIQRLYFIIGGRGSMLSDGRKPLLPGHFYLFPNNLYQEFDSDPDDPINHIYFDFYSTPPIIAKSPLVWDTSDKRAAALAAFLESAINERFRDFGTKSASEEYSHYVTELLRVALMTLSMIKPIPFMTDRIVSDTLAFIRENYEKPLRVADLASRLGFEENYFIRRFKELTGTTPYACLRSFRLTRAAELIASGETISRAAAEVGYENASSLSRALSRQGVGM